MKTEQARKAMLERIRLQGKSYQTYKTYWCWCAKFLDWQKRNRPASGWKDAEYAATAWLTYLTNREHVAATTQNLALQSVCYLYREIMKRPLEGVSAIRSKKPSRVRDVLDQSEILRLFEQLSGVNLLAAQMIYGCGLRIGDVVGLRIKDIHFERCQLHIFDGKGMKDRYCQFPEVLHDLVRLQMESARVLWQWDSANNPNGVSLPAAFDRKSPNACREWRWYYLFPSDCLSRDPMSSKIKRYHRDRSHISREIKRAADRAGIEKRITAHNLRHCYGTHSHEQGVPLMTLKELLGHNSIETTQIYLHADRNGATSAPSPLAALLANPQQIIDRRRAKVGPPKLNIYAG